MGGEILDQVRKVDFDKRSHRKAKTEEDNGFETQYDLKQHVVRSLKYLP